MLPGRNIQRTSEIIVRNGLLVMCVAALLAVDEAQRSPLADEYNLHASRSENARGYAIKITSPAPGAVLTSQQIIVRGEVTIPKQENAIVLVGGWIPDDIVKALRSSENSPNDEAKIALLAMSGQLAVVEGLQFVGM